MKDLSKKIITSLTIGAILTGGCGFAIAATDTAGSFSNRSAIREEKGFKVVDFSTERAENYNDEEKGPKVGFNREQAGNFSDLVSQGIIDQETADKIAAYQSSQAEERKAEMEKVKAMSESERQAYSESRKGNQRTDTFTEMVNAGIITQAQADAIKAALPQGPSNDEDRMNGHMRNFDSFVSQGIIDQETADKIAAYQSSQSEERKAEMEKVKAMSESERQAYFESRKGTQHTDSFTEMINAGIITQAQADAIKAALPAPNRAAD